MRKVLRLLLPDFVKALVVMAVYAVVVMMCQLFGASEFSRVYGRIFPVMAMLMPALLGLTFGARLELALRLGATRRACFWGFEVFLCLLAPLLQAFSVPVLAVLSDGTGVFSALSPSAFFLLVLSGLGLGSLFQAAAWLGAGRAHLVFLLCFGAVMLLMFLGGVWVAHLEATGAAMPSGAPPLLVAALGAGWLASAYGLWRALRRTSVR